MAKMPNNLALPDPMNLAASPDVKRFLTELVKALTKAYEQTFIDIHHKEMVYYDVGGLKWRLGPYPPRTASLPNGNFAANAEDWEFELQFFTGTDYAQQWRDNSNWKRKWLMRGGTD